MKTVKNLEFKDLAPWIKYGCFNNRKKWYSLLHRHFRTWNHDEHRGSPRGWCIMWYQANSFAELHKHHAFKD